MNSHIIANSLKKLKESTPTTGYQESFFNLTETDFVDQLKAVREEYFNTNNTPRKNELKLRFAQIQKRMWQERVDTFAQMVISERYSALSRWEPFENSSTDWFDPEWMFGVKEGFDIVIGNPPYIQLEKSISINSQEKYGDQYAEYKYDTYVKTGDIYCLFYEKGYDLLKTNGVLTYITSNKWMRTGYGEKLRRFLSTKTNPILLLDFAGQKVFDSATVDVNILIFEKRENQGKTLACTAGEDCRNNLSVYVKQQGIISSYLSSNSWIVLNPIEQSIAQKISKHGIPLKDWNINIYRGVLTGLNEAFVIDGATKDRLIDLDPKSAEIIRPILRGRDVQRYGYTFADLWLIATHNGIKDKNIERIDINNYPAIKAHLDSYYFQLEKRADKGDTPYNLRNCVYMDDFSKQKIVWARLSRISKTDFEDFPRFSLVQEGIVVLDSLCFFTGDKLDYLLKILNSKYAAFYFFNSVAILDNGGMQMRQQFVENIPIPQLRDSNNLRQEDVDKAVFAAFELTQQEIEFIETFLEHKRRAIEG